MLDYPLFRFVDTAFGGVNKRNNIMDIHRVKDFIKRIDSYTTYFRYNNEMVFHYREKNSVMGFQGQAYSDWLPIDIDSEDLQEAQDNLERLIGNMTSFGINLNICRYYFSGAKGFHVMIPSKLFGAAPTTDINNRFRAVALALADGIKIDTAIYDKTRIFRLPNTINSKSGLYKIELFYFEALQLGIDTIKELAKQPRNKLTIETEFEVNQQLKEIYESQKEKTFQKKTSEGAKTYLCMAKLNQGVEKGQRDNVGVRVASHLKRSGLSQEMIWAALVAWNDLNKPRLEIHELERIYDQGLSHYEFGCNDYILKANCDKNCLFYKER
jgi:hypothetical protein